MCVCTAATTHWSYALRQHRRQRPPVVHFHKYCKVRFCAHRRAVAKFSSSRRHGNGNNGRKHWESGCRILHVWLLQTIVARVAVLRINEQSGGTHEASGRYAFMPTNDSKFVCRVFIILNCMQPAEARYRWAEASEEMNVEC